jgi:hypothetical protein
MVKDQRPQIYPVADIDIKILGVPAPPGLGMPFLDSDTCAEGGYLFLPGFFPCMMSSMTGRMDGWMNGSREKASLKTTTTSFTI